MKRSDSEVAADFKRIKEAAYWIPLTGHTVDQEIEQFNKAASRLMEDLGCGPLAEIVGDDRERSSKSAMSGWSGSNVQPNKLPLSDVSLVARQGAAGNAGTFGIRSGVTVAPLCEREP